MSVEEAVAEDEGISRYAEPEAEGIMDVCKTNWNISISIRMIERMPLYPVIET